jgi:hypothetical protein
MNRKKENRFFDVYPKIVPSDASTTIVIKDRYHQFFIQEDKEYEVRYFPLERFSKVGEYTYQEAVLIKPVNGALRIEQYFKGEQEHILEIQEKGKDDRNHRMQFHIYSLNPDLYERNPYKGDLHMHTTRSDGKETPGYLTASCRKIGMDFMAVTDHGLYHPSIEAQKLYENLELDLLICRGEEIHPHNNPVHMINFGGNFSVNELFNEKKELYQSEVVEIEKSLESLKEIEDEDSRYQCASCIWCFNKIREGGGLGIFCHPYWLVRDGYYISDTVTSYLIQNQPYDALELIGGYHRFEEESNTLQVARYQEERAKGREIPIVGVSDSHGCEDNGLFGWFYTIVFSPSLDLQEITGSIKSLYSVAVEEIPGESPRVFGPFRLVKYALFLIREVFPEHDELCFNEGNLMLEHLEGNMEAADKLRMLKGQTKKFLKKMKKK